MVERRQAGRITAQTRMSQRDMARKAGVILSVDDLTQAMHSDRNFDTGARLIYE